MFIRPLLLLLIYYLLITLHLFITVVVYYRNISIAFIVYCMYINSTREINIFAFLFLPL